MFTVKVVRVNADGQERLHIYEARSVDVFRDAKWLKTGEAEVVGHQENGEAFAITVSLDPAQSDSYPARAVYVENAKGRTTEIVRAHKVE